MLPDLPGVEPPNLLTGLATHSNRTQDSHARPGDALEDGYLNTEINLEENKNGPQWLTQQTGFLFKTDYVVDIFHKHRKPRFLFQGLHEITFRPTIKKSILSEHTSYWSLEYLLFPTVSAWVGSSKRWTLQSPPEMKMWLSSLNEKRSSFKVGFSSLQNWTNWVVRG